MTTLDPVPDFKPLLIWEKGMLLAERVYQLTSAFPKDERFGLVAQMRRAAVSIPSNIAEGQARRTTGEFLPFLSNAQGSLAELETQTLLSIRLRFCTDTKARPTLDLILELRKMTAGLKRKLSADH
jgi:four helix bundle protein